MSRAGVIFVVAAAGRRGRINFCCGEVETYGISADKMSVALLE